jgi:predicted metal-binding protein
VCREETRIGLVGRLASFLPSPFLESDGTLSAAQAIHRIIVCTLCRDVPTGIRSGESLCADLRTRLAAHDEPAVVHGFAVDGVACMAGCERPLTVAFNAPGKAAYLFGSIDAEADVADLVRFASLYVSLADGWCSSGQRPAGLAGKTLARIPGNLAGNSR